MFIFITVCVQEVDAHTCKDVHGYIHLFTVVLKLPQNVEGIMYIFSKQDVYLTCATYYIFKSAEWCWYMDSLRKLFLYGDVDMGMPEINLRCVPLTSLETEVNGIC